jgi:hypothetical protein
MPLVGTFDVLDFADVLDVLARTGRTGRLQLRAGPVHANVIVADGSLVGADGTAGTGGPPRTTRSLIDDICFEVLRTGRGSFEFHPDPEIIPSEPPVSITAALDAAKRRLEEWRDVETLIPSFDVTPRLAGQLKIDAVTLNQEQWRVLVALDGRRTVAALARRLGLDPLEVCKVLKPLVQDGAVVLHDAEAKAKALPVVSIASSAAEDDPPGGLSEEAATEEAASLIEVPEDRRLRPRLVQLRRPGPVVTSG